MISGFGRACIEPLHADTDAEEWNAPSDGGADGGGESGCIEARGGGEVAHAGEHDALGIFDSGPCRHR